MNQVNDGLDRLRAEIDDLKRQLASAREHPAEQKRSPVSTGKVVVLLVVILVIIVAGFFAGYLPRQRRETVLAVETTAESTSRPLVNVVKVTSSPAKNELSLPGNIQALTEAPVLARANGYIKRRLVDIGDRVRAGQLLAEIEAPELDQQIRQAMAALDQAGSSVEQARAALKQGIANANLAKVTAQRWANLASRGVVSRQENDTSQAQYAAQQANVEALGKAVDAALSNTRAVEANLARLNQLKTYLAVRAPFAGIITLRNVDTGALVNEANTLLFRIADMNRLRVYVNVPQDDASDVKVGQGAHLRFTDLPGRDFRGTVTRTANSLDPATRTLLTEVQVSNSDGALMPGMYTEVGFSVQQKSPTLRIPGDTLVVRSDGPQVAAVAADGTVHFARIQLGRDFGAEIEVLTGLQEGQPIVVNPSDDVREGVKVKAVLAAPKATQRKRS